MSDHAKAIRDALVANLKTIDESLLPSGGLQILPYTTGSPTFPTLWILPGPVTYDEAFQRGHDKEMWRVQALMGSALEEVPQILLDLLKAPSGPTSVKAAIEQKDDAHQRRVTLGGAAVDARVTGCTGFVPVDGAMFGYHGTPVISCDWTVEVDVKP